MYHLKIHRNMAYSSLDRITNNLMNKFLETYEIQSSGLTKDFENFAVYCAIKDNYSPHFESENFHSVMVGGISDTGIDGIGIIINNNLLYEVEDLEDYIGNKESVDTKFIFVQATISKKFNAAKFRDFTIGVQEFFYDYARPEEIKTKNRNNFINKKVEISNNLLDATTHMSDRPTCKLYYFLGNDVESKLGINNKVIESEKQKIIDLGLFDSKVEIEVKGTSYLNSLYRQTFIKPKITINFPYKISLPEINKIKESYIGRISFEEFKKLIINESSGSVRDVFEDNVRYFNEEYDINKKIKQSIQTGNIDEFVLLNNGVTIVTKKLTVAADRFTLQDYQIINGCQTSNILYQCRNEPDIENLWLTLKIIHTEDREIINKITTATNSQTQVSVESLFSLLNFHKKLENYYQSSSYKLNKEEIILFYAR